ncbi:MAG: deoxyribodipyrimidine photo-lyase [Alphaproteobacteria bacterium]
MSDRPVIVWFRQDLRLSDHPALRAAAETGRPIVPLYVLDETEAGERTPGGASKWYLHGSLAKLAASLRRRHGGLVLRRGPVAETVARLVQEIGAEAIFLTRAYTPGGIADETALAKQLDVKRYGGALLWEPEAVETKDGGPYKVFTPFHRACQAQREPAAPKPAPENLTLISAPGDDLDDWGLLPTRPDWAGGLRESWTPGEAGAQARLAAFADCAVADYADGHDRPDVDGTSRLSPALHFGEISPRQAWHAVGDHRGGAAFRRELVWREFCAHLLFHFPDLPTQPFKADFADFPWRVDEAALLAWQRGQTGYPLVDAGMRQLWETGWMHNRVRMVVASFLVKHLLIGWWHGEAWFWDTLVDADLANNVGGWQWVAGCGADAAPYFRIFNPILQGQKFDPDGAYVRRWVPALRDIPDAHVHEPWKAGGAAPIVDHAAARQRALAALKATNRG